ncbi:MAG: replicative DNA helicase [bacterium]
MSIRIPPQNIESEKALLGSIMLDPKVINDVLDHVNSDSFYAEKHRIIFKSMMELNQKSEPIDLLTVSTKLKENKVLEQVGGMSYLTDLVNTVPSASSADFYAQMVKKKFTMRQLIEAAEHISGLGYDEANELETLLEGAEKRIYEVTHAASGAGRFMEMREALGEAWDRWEKLHNSKDGYRGVPTGFKQLDDMLSGLQKSDLIILAARPSMGKTSLALDIARQSAIHHGARVAIFSLEMSNQQLVDRMVAAESRVDAWKLRTGKMSMDEEFEKLREALEPLSKAPIFVDDKPGATIQKMRSTVRRLQSEKGVDLIVVDYLQLITPTKSKSDNVVQQITEISRDLKNMAREFNVPVLALSQLSRAVEQRGGRPRLSDLRDSGSIEQDADVVMFIHREQNDEGGGRKMNAEILIEKHRNGPTGKVDLFFDANKSTFLPIDKNNDFGAFSGDVNGGNQGGSF